MTAMSPSARVRSQISHPVVDGDGHWLEPVPMFMDYLDGEGGPKAVEGWRAWKAKRDDWYGLTAASRLARRCQRGGWWATPANALDRATASFPRLLYERLPDFGIDFAIIYPTLGLNLSRIPEEDLRRHCCRALNRLSADSFAEYSDRLTPAASIPVFSPQEAVDELEFVSGHLGLKVIMMSGTLLRSVPSEPKRQYVDTLGLDSFEDYDRLWEKCSQLRLSITDHGGSFHWPNRQSTTNFVFNHLGHFASAQHASCSAIFLGGVPRRYPRLNFGFLEGGAGWGSNLLLDLMGHWEKRSVPAMNAHLRPTNVDLEEFQALFDKYAPPAMRKRYTDLAISPDCTVPFHSLEELAGREIEAYDDFELCGVSSSDELRNAFSRSFYFGCEADDPMTAVAFDGRLGIRLKPFFSSDIGHFDVTDMTEVLHEAWELVERGLITEEDFMEFTFINGVELHGRWNRNFFKGTAIESAAAEALAERI